MNHDIVSEPRIPVRGSPGSAMGANPGNRGAPLAKPRWVSLLQCTALVVVIVGLYSYALSGCPAAAARSSAARLLVVIPTDARGKLEYCAFATQAMRGMTREATGGPLENLCGPDRAEVEARAKAYQQEIMAQGQRCYVRSLVPRVLSGLFGR
ncbi:hypothetical protein G3A43_08640 [Paraburkholderia aspalathi]|nr:hypothetical protein [Paraburkholderia aspalathi]MBK3780324.1 hypothetical protein [Paraburkholderia aspalathi]